MLRPERTVLLVEDNEDDERLMRKALSMNGRDLKIHCVRTGSEAVDFLNGSAGESPTCPDLILLDLKLGNESGVDVLLLIRSLSSAKSTPVIIVSSSDEVADVISSYDAGANGYVRKPVRFEDFIEAIRHLEQYWLGINTFHKNVASSIR